MNIKIPNFENLSYKKPDIEPITMPKVNIPSMTFGNTSKKTLSHDERKSWYRQGYDAGYSGLPNISVDKDTVNDWRWLEYSCGYPDGESDRESGRPPTY